MRAILLLGALLVGVTTPTLASHGADPIPCPAVRELSKQFSDGALVRMARARGLSEEQIKFVAKKCLGRKV